MSQTVCKQCGGDKLDHLIFVLHCRTCGNVQPLPEGDTTGRDFLVERYTNPTEDNRPGQDVLVPRPSNALKQ